MASVSKRSGYIDAVKFLFALTILDFHLGTGLLPGGRVAVEGFFMISGYLMMVTLHKNHHPEDSLGISTLRFLWGKYKALLPILIPSALIGYIVNCIRLEYSLKESLVRFPMLFFDIFPLRILGFKAEYVTGLSWYISAMFFALAVLYPICKKCSSSCILSVFPGIALLLYGALSYYYGNLAVTVKYLEGSLVSSGFLRGLAGCGLGCVLYEIKTLLASRMPTRAGRILFSAAEVLGFALFFFYMHFKPKSRYDYLLIFVIFVLLLIGLCGLSYSAKLPAKWMKPLGTWSTLIVFNHYAWKNLFEKLLGKGYAKTEQVWMVLAAVFLAGTVVWLLSFLVRWVMKKLPQIPLWKK